jgi:hypothetical protein
LDADFFAGVSLAFLPFSISISFWPDATLRGFLDGFEVFAVSVPPTL